MNTSSKAATKLNISEAKTFESFEIISPSIDTSSSTVTIESITAHISSKSSSPFNALGFKDSSRQSPLSEATVPNYAGDLNTKSLLKSPISSGTRSPTDSPLLPFLNDTYHHNKQQIQQRDIILNNRFENMLSSSSNNNQQTPPTTTTGVVLLASNASSPSNSIKNIKCEPFSTLSPLSGKFYFQIKFIMLIIQVFALYTSFSFCSNLMNCIFRLFYRSTSSHCVSTSRDISYLNICVRALDSHTYFPT